MTLDSYIRLEMVMIIGWITACAYGTTLYVAPDGSDAWTGSHPTANATRTDGPLATLQGARDAVRKVREQSPDEPVIVQFRGGVYPILETVVFTPRDSGSEDAPIRYAAYPGETPMFYGGRRIRGWKKQADGTLTAQLPPVQDGEWTFRQLFSGNERLTRARCPNADTEAPLRKGFFYVAANAEGFGCTVGCIHNRGDWLRYEPAIPQEGDYVVWMRYGANNGGTEWETFDMAGRTTLTIDERQPIALTDLPDTGGWQPSRWGRTARIHLEPGTHTLTWTNVKGGGINIDALALCSDAEWKPTGTDLAPPAEGEHLIVMQAEAFAASQGKQLRISAGGGSPTEFTYKSGDFKPEWADIPGAEVHIFQSGSCRAFKEILSVESVDRKTRTVRVGGETKADLQAGDRYFVENLPGELDAAGEWYFDRRTGKLQLRTAIDTNPQDLDVVAPEVCELVRFEGDSANNRPVKHITFSGFTVRYTGMTLNDGCEGYGMGTKGVFQLNGASQCTIEACRFENCGRYAMAAVSGTGIRFVRCTVADSGQGGVLLIDSAHCEVTDCTMERLGAIYKHIGGVVLTGANASDNRVAHNLIRDSARYGITCKNAGLRNLIEYNALYRMSTETHDTGGIEVTQHHRTQRSMSVIRNNLVVDVIGYSSTFETPTYMSWGIYLDSFAGGYTIENNVSVRCSHGVMIQGGQGNTIQNNVFVDGSVVQFTFSNFAGNSLDNIFRRNIIYWTDADAAFGWMGKGLEDTLAADHNLWFCSDRALADDEDWAKWRRNGFGEHDVIADPQFQDAANDDYRLLPTSPALALGFNPIDLSDVGPRER